MSGSHQELGPELRALAQSILDRIDPALRAAAAMAAARAGEGPGRCQQVWCPVCALAAVVTGEEHPLLTVISEHSVALLAVVRAIVDGTEPQGPPDQPPEGTPAGADEAETGSTGRPGRYESISVTVEE